MVRLKFHSIIFKQTFTVLQTFDFVMTIKYSTAMLIAICKGEDNQDLISPITYTHCQKSECESKSGGSKQKGNTFLTNHTSKQK